MFTPPVHIVGTSTLAHRRPDLLQLSFRKQDVFSNTRIIFHKLKFLRQCSWILALDIKEARAGTADKLDQKGRSLLGHPPPQLGC